MGKHHVARLSTEDRMKIARRAINAFFRAHRLQEDGERVIILGATALRQLRDAERSIRYAANKRLRQEGRGQGKERGFRASKRERVDVWVDNMHKTADLMKETVHAFDCKCLICEADRAPDPSVEEKTPKSDSRDGGLQPDLPF